MSYNGGDDLNALVLDLGESVSRVGFAGDDAPRYMQSAAIGCRAIDKDNVEYFVGDEVSFCRRDNVEITSHISDGLFDNWDKVECLLNHALKSPSISIPSKGDRAYFLMQTYLCHTSSERPFAVRDVPFLMAEPSFNTRDKREKMCEMMFEKYEVPAFFLGNSASLCCYANGRTTGLVLDIGGGTTCATPVNDGFALRNLIKKSPLTGRAMDEVWLRLIEKKATVFPNYAIKKTPRGMHLPPQIEKLDTTKVSSSFEMFGKLEVVRDLKENIGRCSELSFDEAANASIPTVPYELPDGKVVQIGGDRFMVPEMYFDPSIPRLNIQDVVSVPDSPTGIPDPLPKLVCDAVLGCETDVRRDLFGNVVLSGGGSCFEGMPVRMERELTYVAPPVFKVKVLSAQPSERKLSAWLGGSILGSLGTFHELWISKAEYEEHGAPIVERKCP